VWLEAGGLPPDDGVREPPPSEKPLCVPREEEEEELPVDCDTLWVDEVTVAGCPCRARPTTTAKPAAAVRATARFAALARLRPASTLVAPGMSPSSRSSLRPRCERAESAVRTFGRTYVNLLESVGHHPIG
jgi:hypothetical protein